MPNEEASVTSISVEVAYAPTPAQQYLCVLSVPAGSSVAQVLAQEALLAAGIDAAAIMPIAVGIFGKTVNLEHIVREQDRIELYRALIADPKTARRQRAAQRANNGS